MTAVDRGALPARLAFFAVLLGAWAGGVPLFLFLNGARSPGLDPVMLAVTELGNAALTGLLLALLAPFRRREALTAALAILLAGVAADLLKDMFAAPRPLALLGSRVHALGFPLQNGSFPSGHTATAFAAVSALRGAFAPRVWWPLLGAAALVGYSRVYIGAHFPIDAAAGAFLGWLAGDLARGPFLPAVERAARAGVVADRAFLVVGLLCAVFLGWFERLLAYQFWFLRPVGVLGAAACLALLARSFAGRREP